MAVTSTKESSVKRKDVEFKRIEINDSYIYLYSKRFIDIFGSVLGLILLSPLFILVGILIKIEDPKGPIIFRQKRVGKNQSEFHMCKFRSMVSNAEELKVTLIEKNELSGPVFKIKNDPRITKVGKFIRKTSLDELPQLFNVLKGEMSLVGPRPPLPSEVELYNEYEKQRLSITPGLTCYWQVSGRNNIGFDEWVELDLKYIKERSVFLDLKLILKTILVLFGSKNAY
ncbi:sugar transferase [Virgibacillus sp. MSP4-1]|uniref:sugar transferase n=1 Tax=Virgibacillus sp. MSP4-1 TaxID=2700081 RepID=UPI0003AAF2A5|nr:sugar transferase [Virgibacillus sp. MSP4-1]QHS23498.1 sugar transferase [Virgibacillus sp. MSP4-1]